MLHSLFLSLLGVSLIFLLLIFIAREAHALVTLGVLLLFQIFGFDQVSPLIFHSLRRNMTFSIAGPTVALPLSKIGVTLVHVYDCNIQGRHLELWYCGWFVMELVS